MCAVSLIIESQPRVNDGALLFRKFSRTYFERQGLLAGPLAIWYVFILVQSAKAICRVSFTSSFQTKAFTVDTNAITMTDDIIMIT